MNSKTAQTEDLKTVQNKDLKIIAQSEDDLKSVAQSEDDLKIIAQSEDLKIVIHSTPAQSPFPHRFRPPVVVTYDLIVNLDQRPPNPAIWGDNFSNCTLFLTDYLDLKGSEIDLSFLVDRMELRLIAFHHPHAWWIAPLVLVTFFRGEEKWNVMKRLSEDNDRFFLYRRQVYLGRKFGRYSGNKNLCSRLFLFPRDIAVESVTAKPEPEVGLGEWGGTLAPNFVPGPEDLSNIVPLLVDRTSAPETIICCRREQDMTIRLFRLGSLGRSFRNEVEFLFSSQQTYKVSADLLPHNNDYPMGKKITEVVWLDAEGRLWLHKYRDGEYSGLSRWPESLSAEPVLTVLAPDFSLLLSARVDPELRIFEAEGIIYATFYRDQDREAIFYGSPTVNFDYYRLEVVAVAKS